MSKREMAPSSSSSPCAACKFLRRKCTAECVFAPYFPPDQPHKFANVHKIFGASNITKLLNELAPHQREDAVNSLAYEAEARMKDPVYGCVGAISILQRQMHHLQRELAAAHADLARYTGGAAVTVSNPVALLQQGPGGSLGMGMGMQASSGLGISMAGTSHSMHHQQQQTQQQQVFDGQLTREQLAELARVGGGCYEAGFAALGINSNSNSSIPPSPTVTGGQPFNHRLPTGSDGASRNSGGGGSMGHLSPH
ncbi:hypothetical protein SUGI_0762790 [Cryptomeria japonica]|uniref:protein LATERAL ORGAN BOUNDARIES n=1 Tax=Cryptomeria japonica TaxID=3369 RepID=UPI002414C159|nr:protein LATERAL ORGAN BOUNDARIES [Cryptomeria japonica]GLJ37537.1 hypothetical protein SUGI_0762790 [Cryptomeria japonica]